VEPQRTYEDLSRWLVGAIGSAPTALRNVEAAGLAAGHDLAVASTATGVDGLHQAIASLGFQPSLPKRTGNDVTFSLSNCPYRDAVRENPEVVCALHRGLTSGLLERLAPHTALTNFVPKDPDKVGCIISLTLP